MALPKHLIDNLRQPLTRDCAVAACSRLTAPTTPDQTLPPVGVALLHVRVPYSDTYHLIRTLVPSALRAEKQYLSLATNPADASIQPCRTCPHHPILAAEAEQLSYAFC